MEYLMRLLIILPFSLPKYSAILAEVKRYFGIHNNQLGRVTNDDVRGSPMREMRSTINWEHSKSPGW
jgi:hypothetical protein